jgi:stage II sporulation protein D
MAPPLVRVLLQRTARSVTLGQPGRPYRVAATEGTVWVWGPLQLSVEDPGVFQVAAVADLQAAMAAAARLASQVPGLEPVVEPGTDGLVRIRVRWPGGTPPDPKAVLAAAGYEGAFPVRGAARVRVDASSGGPIVAPGEVVLEPSGEWPVAVGGLRYRGRLRLRAIGDELLVINELSLETYLRGVVPVEMGPGQFPELEALKAQAVAARTYAVAHLHDHDDEGYDLCDSPACQAYNGAGVEHPLTDRAVGETAGLVVTFEGAPIDAMFTSTCGGHTDDAEALFPGRGAPYLKGVVCSWERELSLAGAFPSGDWRDRRGFEVDIGRRALGLTAEVGDDPTAVVAAVATACSGRQPTATRDFATVDDFVAALLAAAGLETAALVHGGGDPEERLLDLADLFEIDLGPAPAKDWGSAWAIRAGLATLRLQGVVTVDRGELVPHPSGAAIYPLRADRSEPLPVTTPLYEGVADAVRPRQQLSARPGTTLERWRRGNDVVAVVVIRSRGDGDADRRSSWRQWSRDREWDDLATRLGVPDLERLTITARTEAGRVVGLEAVGRAGARRQWQGFEIRRVLELPENLFTMHVLTRADGSRIVRFLGRGWGHGIGLCQHGSYGLARAGMTYDRILGHYYPGTAVVSWP